MEQTDNNKRPTRDNALMIEDLLFSCGYLPPRKNEDLDRFDRLYKNKVFKIENYSIDADAIFNSVASKVAIIRNKKNSMSPKVDHNKLKAAGNIKGK